MFPLGISLLRSIIDPFNLFAVLKIVFQERISKPYFLMTQSLYFTLWVVFLSRAGLRFLCELGLFFPCSFRLQGLPHPPFPSHVLLSMRFCMGDKCIVFFHFE